MSHIHKHVGHVMEPGATQKLVKVVMARGKHDLGQSESLNDKHKSSQILIQVGRGWFNARFFVAEEKPRKWV